MKKISKIAVYMGSSGHARPVFKESAEDFGRLIGAHNMELIYGGMDAGLMGLVAKRALEGGAHVTGIVPRRLKDSERILESLSETILVEELWDRKKKMFMMVDAIVCLPGGFGTLDEMTEVLFWADLGLHEKPLILVNTDGYWDSLIDYFKGMPCGLHPILHVVDDAKATLALLEKLERKERFIPYHLPHFEDEISRKTDQPLIIDYATIENTYFSVCALGLKQLQKHQRPIGFLNVDGRFDGLLAWFELAAREAFITDHCLKLYDFASDEDSLRALLKQQKPVLIDLHNDKWGDAEA